MGILCQPKDHGGLGIANLNLKNIALLSKWFSMLLMTYDTWRQLLRIKYLGSKPLVQVEQKQADSHLTITN
jgi:hypothetical protein